VSQGNIGAIYNFIHFWFVVPTSFIQFPEQDVKNNRLPLHQFLLYVFSVYFVLALFTGTFLPYSSFQIPDFVNPAPPHQVNAYNFKFS
jgi:ATP/ADP translocase